MSDYRLLASNILFTEGNLFLAEYSKNDFKYDNVLKSLYYKDGKIVNSYVFNLYKKYNGIFSIINFKFFENSLKISKQSPNYKKGYYNIIDIINIYNKYKDDNGIVILKDYSIIKNVLFETENIIKYFLLKEFDNII
jgi:hypothetical protein